MVLGNHDYGRGLDRRVAHRQVAWAGRTQGFEMPSSTYAFRAGRVDLFAIDTNDVFWKGSEPHRTWLREGIQASDAPWKVAFGHHTFRSEAAHGNAGDYESIRGIPWADGASLQELFEEELCGQVDLYLAGHDHNLQWIEHCGLTLLVTGAGAKARPLAPRGNTLLYGLGDEGFVWVELAPGRLTAAFYDEQGALGFEAWRDDDGRVWITPEPVVLHHDADLTPDGEREARVELPPPELFWDPEQGLLGEATAEYPAPE